jgi:F-type H+-transporting ATPase subunit delta
MKGSLLSREIAEPYAQALMSVAKSHHVMEGIGEDIRNLLSLTESSPELRDFINSPVIQGTDKQAVLRRLIGDSGSPYLLNFLLLLIDKGRAPFLEAICQQYLVLLRQQTNTVLAEVTAARELTDEQRHAVSEKVKELTGAQAVELKSDVNPELIGGVVIKVGSQIFDASLKGQLRRLSISLQ